MQAPFADPLSGLELVNKVLPLVGREAEMQAIRALLDTVALNRPIGAGALMISGEVGMGKSRLLAEMYLEARARGFRVLEGRTYESGGMFPYLPFIEALRPVLRFSTLEDLRRYVGLAHPADRRQDAAEMISLTGTPLVAPLACLFPELPRILHVTIQPEVLSPDQEKFRLFDAVATLLERLSMERPVLLGIDNLQWADSASLELTMYLTVRLHGTHVALVGVTRPPGTVHERAERGISVPQTEFVEVTMATNIAAARALSDLMRQGLLLFLPLGPLDTEAADRHLHALLPGTIPQELAQFLLNRAEGNPFFLEELVRALTLNQMLVLRNGEWRATRPINTEIPESITLAVEQRLHGLSSACRELLRVASLFGRTFALPALAQVLEEPEDEIEVLINEGVKAAAIAKVPGVDRDEHTNNVEAPQPSLPASVEVPPRDGVATTFMFCQGIVQEVLSAEVSTARARWLHGAIGAALEANYIDAAPTHAAELARHYALSGDKQAALRWSLLAGEHAARQQAHREAVGHFHLVLRLLEAGVSSPTSALGEPLAGALPSPAELHLLIGESWFKLGELEQALNAFQQALQHLQKVVVTRSLGEPAVVSTHTYKSTNTKGQHSLLLARTNRLMADVYRMQSKYDQALAHLQAARTAFDTQANASEESNVALDEVAQVIWFPGRSFPVSAQFIMPLAGTQGISLEHVSTTERILFLQAQATLDILLNRTQEAEAELWQSHQLATETGDQSSQAFALQLLGWLRGWGERIYEAIRFQEQAHELYVAIGDPFRAALVDQVLGIVYQALGEMERARLCTLRGFERARRYGARRILGLLHWNHGVMALAQGDWTSSGARLQQALQEAETNNDARLKPIVLQAQAELHFRQGNWREAEQLFQASIQAASANEWYPGTIALYGHFLAVTGRGHRKSAQEQLDRAATHPEPPGLAGSFYIPFLAEGYIHVGANERAAAYIERIRSMRGFMHYGTSVDRILGVVATLAGDWETAEQAFEDGLALCRRANNEPEEATILYEQARAALLRRDTDSEYARSSLQRMHDLCDRARELFLRYSMRRAADLVDTVQEGVRELERPDDVVTLPAPQTGPPIREIGIQSRGLDIRRVVGHPKIDLQSSPSEYHLTLHLTERELEVLRLVAEGHTDREVAETLVISPRTVNRHLSNIFVKLDVPGRAAAVAYAIRQGIV